MAWFWNTSRDGEEEEEEEEYDDEEEEEDEEYSSEAALSEGEDFAEEEVNDNELEVADQDDPPVAPTTKVKVSNDARNRIEGGEDILSLKKEPMERGSNGGDGDDDSLMREDEFAQLVAAGGESSSSSLNRSNNQKDGQQLPFNHNNSDAQDDEATAKITPHKSSQENHAEPTEQIVDNEVEEEVTTLEEKQSLLVLAAEHDRVDILQAILSSPSSSEDKTNQHNLLLHGGGGDKTPPPLHIAVAHGSVNAVNCLLRMGADPSIRSPSCNGKTAWEVAFDNTTNNNNIAPSKREGIRHAFTAEALRCIGADEVERLQQLLLAGLPKDCDVGGRSLAEWTVDLGASQCQELVGVPSIVEQTTANNANSRNNKRVLHEEGLPALENRLEELNNLSKALSQFLDNLAEEVSVCSGLLLVGSGAAALAAHVKSLKQQKLRLQDDLERHALVWENSEDELAYWVRECGGVDILKTLATTGKQPPQQLVQQQQQEQQQTSGSPTEEESVPNNIATDEIHRTQQLQRLQTQIAACETKIRMLRASIADLSDENQRNLVQVERRGLQGGVRLVRTLREEIVELEFQLAEIDSAEAACRAKIQLLQQYLKTNPMIVKHQKQKQAESTQPTGETIADNDPISIDDDAPPESAATNPPSHYSSTALIVRPKGGNQGFLPFSIWQLFLRIMGLSSHQQHQHHQQQPVSYNRPAMIV